MLSCLLLMLLSLTSCLTSLAGSGSWSGSPWPSICAPGPMTPCDLRACWQHAAGACTSTHPRAADVARMSPVELAELVTEYGFADRVTAVAVILGESGGDPSATNREPGNVDRGLWQISSKWHPNVSDAEAYDVQASTAYALQLSSGGSDFNPWHATRASQFASHRRTAEQAVAEHDQGDGDGGQPWWKKVPIPNVPGMPNPGAIGAGAGAIGDAADKVGGAVTGAVSGVGDVLGYAGKALSVLTSADFWKRAAWALAGLALVVLGVWAIFGRDITSGLVAAKTGGAVTLPDDDAE